MCIRKIYTPGAGRKFSAPLAESFVPAGFPSPADDYIEKALDLNEYLIANQAATFFVRVSGDSMTGAGIHDGDILIVDRSIDPVRGQVAVAVIDGEMTVKRLRWRGGKLTLEPENDKYPPIEINSESECLIWGVVTYVIHAL